MRTEGRSRSDYMQLLQKDLAFYYGYNECLMTRLMQLFPLSEISEVLEANEVQRPVTLRTNTLRTRRRDLAQVFMSCFILFFPTFPVVLMFDNNPLRGHRRW
jgi:ribosomal RNA methyltransferase Nop2